MYRYAWDACMGASELRVKLNSHGLVEMSTERPSLVNVMQFLRLWQCFAVYVMQFRPSF